MFIFYLSKKYKTKNALLVFLLSLLLAPELTFAITPDSSSSWETRNYPNYFSFLASEEDVDARINEIYNQLFGSNQSLSIIRNHSNSGVNAQYILAVDSNDIRSEGMSYGMIIAVMMDDQTTFDRLWRFVVNEMWQHDEGNATNNPSIGDRFNQLGGNVNPGWVGWSHLTSNGYPKNTNQGGQNPAPDGEEYMAMALFMADNRWGSSNSNSNLENWTRNYEERARDMLDVIRDHLWDNNANQILFSPTTTQAFTDPSYHLPAFYEIFGEWSLTLNDFMFWKIAADVSRNLLVNSAHPTTGLAPTYSQFTGAPMAENTNSQWFANDYAYDSWRVIQNLGMDYSWWSADDRLRDIVHRQWGFLNSDTHCGGTYCNIYTLNGGVPGGNGVQSQSSRAEGQVAMNAVGALASGQTFSWIIDLWNQETPTGNFRYYNGLLHLLGYLHVSGRFIIVRPFDNNAQWLDKDNPSGQADSELLQAFLNQGRIDSDFPCLRNHTSRIQAQVVGQSRLYGPYEQNFEYFNAAQGLRCDSNSQQQCENYEVRYHCTGNGGFWTNGYFNSDNPNNGSDVESTSSHAIPSNCGVRDRIQARVVGTTSPVYEGTPNRLNTFSAEEGLHCRNSEQPAGWPQCRDYRFRLLCH